MTTKSFSYEEICALYDYLVTMGESGWNEHLQTALEKLKVLDDEVHNAKK